MWCELTSLERKLQRFKGPSGYPEGERRKGITAFGTHVFTHRLKHELERAKWGNKLVVH